jgi:hypothetical protein
MNKEEFESMKQLDRIEYILRKSRIENELSFQTPSFIWNIIEIFAFLLVLTLLMYIAFESKALFSIFEPLAQTIKYIIIAVIIWDVISYMVYVRRVKQLNERFKK